MFELLKAYHSKSALGVTIRHAFRICVTVLAAFTFMVLIRYIFGIEPLLRWDAKTLSGAVALVAVLLIDYVREIVGLRNQDKN